MRSKNARVSRFLLTFVLGAASALAQVTVPFPTFVAGTVINPDEVNANFAKFSDALNRTGGTITGNITVNGGVTIDGVDIGTQACTTCSPTFAALTTTGLATLNSLSVTTTAIVGTTLAVNSTGAAAIDVAGGAQFGTGNVSLIGTDGRIVDITSTRFASLSGANLTTLNATNLSSGTVADARLSNNVALLADNETVTGLWDFNVQISTTTINMDADVALNMQYTGSGLTEWVIQPNAGAPQQLRISNVSGGAFTGTGARFQESEDTLLLERIDGVGDVGLRFVTGTQSLQLKKTDTGGGITLSGNGTPYTQWNNTNLAPQLVMSSGAYGTGGVPGPSLFVESNTSGNDAPGFIGFRLKSTGISVVWVDSSSDLRILNGSAIGPTENNTTVSDTAGVVVGTQTSQRAAKHIYGQVTDTAWALAEVLQTPVWAFDYKSGAYNAQQFVGITTDDSPLFAMDAGRSFNPVTAFGVTVLALQEIERRLRALEAIR